MKKIIAEKLNEENCYIVKIGGRYGIVRREFDGNGYNYYAVTPFNKQLGYGGYNKSAVEREAAAYKNKYYMLQKFMEEI